MKQLIDRNKWQSKESTQQEEEKIPIPFVLLETDSKTMVDLNIASDK
jgi:hypothetical protein